MTDQLEQLALSGIKLQDDATFANFYIATNRQLVMFLQQFCAGYGEKVVYLWGASSVGKSHLLQACCHSCSQLNKRAIYLSGRYVIAQQFGPQMLENLSHLDLICIDDLDAIVGLRSWEEGLFHCFNQLLETGCRLLVTAQENLSQLCFGLPDLQSRLQAGLLFQVQALTDGEKVAALTLRAANRGLSLSEQVGRFLLHRYQRDTKTLFEILDVLDQASLIQQRKLTIPFVKSILK